MRELPEVLPERVESVHSYLSAGGGQPALRVAASVTQLGLVARLISPALACQVHSGSMPAMDLNNLWWQPITGSLFPLSVDPARTGTWPDLLTGPVTDLTRLFAVSERVLWGNIASAINGAATMIGTARPDFAAEATALATTMLNSPELRHTSIRRPDGRFQRRSCCLIYQASPTKSRNTLCGDCVLA